MEYIEIGVNPGIVLISLSSTSPAVVTKQSTRDSPSAPIASKASTASSRTRSATSSGRSAGASVRAWVAERYFDSKS